ncbi:riboflavin biosynthesis protein RibF [bacterium]|nr:riboflavin biosynthesis protein RibF [bacterium]
MKTEYLSKPLPLLSASAVAVGCFDGLHIGHREVLRRLLVRARDERQSSVVFTFSPHPKELFGGSRFRLLTPLREKVPALAALGIDVAVIARFDAEFASLSAERFVTEYLKGSLGMKVLIVGADHGFGAGRGGGIDVLRSLSSTEDFDVEVVEPVLWNGEPVKSSRIRESVVAGDMSSAAHMLGRPYSISGELSIGHGRGRRLGFPTMNIKPPKDKLLPKTGVYAAADEGGIPGLLYIGTSPTFGDGEAIAEFHGLSRPVADVGSIYSVSLFERFRDEIAFPNAAALVEQMKADMERLVHWTIATGMNVDNEDVE